MHLDASWVKAENSVPNSWQRGFICKWRMDSRAPEPLGWHRVALLAQNLCTGVWEMV